MAALTNKNVYIARKQRQGSKPGNRENTIFIVFSSLFFFFFSQASVTTAAAMMIKHAPNGRNYSWLVPFLLRQVIKRFHIEDVGMAVVNIHIQAWIPLQLTPYIVTHNHPYTSSCSRYQQVRLAATFVGMVMWQCSVLAVIVFILVCVPCLPLPSAHITDFYEIFLLLVCALFFL